MRTTQVRWHRPWANRWRDHDPHGPCHCGRCRNKREAQARQNHDAPIGLNNSRIEAVNQCDLLRENLAMRRGDE
jgi:hypothetical protein